MEVVAWLAQEYHPSIGVKRAVGAAYIMIINLLARVMQKGRKGSKRCVIKRRGCRMVDWSSPAKRVERLSDRSWRTPGEIIHMVLDGGGGDLKRQKLLESDGGRRQ